ncbi:hypothetical protein CKJ89_38595, partial [Klebsiella pneumoniae]
TQLYAVACWLKRMPRSSADWLAKMQIIDPHGALNYQSTRSMTQLYAVACWLKRMPRSSADWLAKMQIIDPHGAL